MVKEELLILEGSSATFEKGVFSVSKQGKAVSKKLDHPAVKIRIEGAKIVLEGKNDSRRSKKLVNTYKAHIKNMLQGLEEDYVYKLKICSSHFPIDVSVKDDEVIIKNFLGERKPRKAKIIGGANVKISEGLVIVSSPNKEAAGQTAANIENATRISNYDRRRFQDGIYMTVKAGVSI